MDMGTFATTEDVDSDPFADAGSAGPTSDAQYYDAVAVDTNHDGVVDMVEIDSVGDGNTHLIEFPTEGVSLDVDTGQVTSLTDPASADASTSASSTVNPSTTDSAGTGEATPPGTHGDPQTDLQWAETQTQDGGCLPTSVAMIASEFSGTHVPESDVVSLAEQDGYTSADASGNLAYMSLDQGQNLLEAYGIPSHVENGTTDSLRQYLDQGRSIVLAVDGNDIWGQPEHEGASSDTANHAVVITGIDDSTGMVTLDDPGLPTGAGEQVPLATLEEAWRDGGNQMLVTDSSPASPGFAVLPVNLDPSELRL
jgi:hypothetical protein